MMMRNMEDLKEMVRKATTENRTVYLDEQEMEEFEFLKSEFGYQQCKMMIQQYETEIRNMFEFKDKEEKFKTEVSALKDICRMLKMNKDDIEYLDNGVYDLNRCARIIYDLFCIKENYILAKRLFVNM